MTTFFCSSSSKTYKTFAKSRSYKRWINNDASMSFSNICGINLNKDTAEPNKTKEHKVNE